MENLPRTPDGRLAGAWICAGVPHRNWAEPFVLFWALPARPRLVAVADGPAVSRSPLRRLVINLAGGVVAVWPRGSAREFERHLVAVQQVIDAGAVLLIFPEKGPPARAPGLRRLSPSVAHFAQRTGAPIVPVVLGGTDELYLRRRIEVRILPALDPPRPDAGRAGIAEFMDRFGALIASAAVDAHQRAEADAP